MKYSYRRNSFIFIIFKIYLFIFILCLIIILILLLKPNNKDNLIDNIEKIKRSTAYKRGMEMINYTWKFDYLRNGINNEEIILPRYLKDGELVSGIPYCWGGYISLDLSNQPQVKNFKDALQKGYIAGNINTSGGYKPLTAGLDCSGFVSAVYKLPQKASTEDLGIYFYPIKFEDLKPMDILNSKKNHVFIYLKESADKKGIITMEATTGKNIFFDRTIINYRRYEDIKKDIENGLYVPMRYRKIQDDKVKIWMDQYEFNNFDYLATSISIDKNYNGTIDYAGDVDIFSITLSKGTYKIIFEGQDFIIGDVIAEDTNILSFNMSGEYEFNLSKNSNIKIKIYTSNLKYKISYQFILKK